MVSDGSEHLRNALGCVFVNCVARAHYLNGSLLVSWVVDPLTVILVIVTFVSVGGVSIMW